MIITIGGKAGSGKSTLARMLAEKLGIPHHYMGGLRRKMAEERGMTLAEFNALGEREGWTDKEVDDYQKKLGQTEDNFIIEGRTSFFLIPHSLKIYIDVDERVGAERVYHELQKEGNRRNEGAGLDSVEDVLASHRHRTASDTARYKKYYDVNAYDLNHYDFVLDTSSLTIEQAFEKLYQFVISRKR